MTDKKDVFVDINEAPITELIRGLSTYSPYYITKICTINLEGLDTDIYVNWMMKYHPKTYFGSLYLTTHNPYCWDVSLPLDYNNTDYSDVDTGKKIKFPLGRREKDINKWLKASYEAGVVSHEFNWKDPNLIPVKNKNINKKM